MHRPRPGAAWLTRCALIGASLTLGAARAAPAQQVGDAAVARELDGYIRQGMKDWGIPGLSVAVVRRDSVVLLRGYGVLQQGNPAPVDEHTLFGMMSTTKAMTAMAIAMLVDDGRLGWHDPVSRWVPEFAMPEPWVTADLRVVDLLTHNAGLGNADLLWSRQDLSAGEIFRRVRLLQPAYPLRGGFGYQNVMYGLAGEVVTRASGLPYGEFLRRRLFGPLGMIRTYPSYAAMTAVRDRNVSRPHYRIGDTVRVIDDETVDILPAAGAVWSTAADMASWLAFLLDSARIGGRRLISDSNVRRVFAPQALIGPEEFYPTATLTRPHWTSYGLGWFQQDYRGHFVAFHTGSLDGRTAIIGLLPEERAGVYVFGNLDHAEFRHALMLKAFDLFLGGPARDWSAELLRLYGERRSRADSTRAARDRQRVLGTEPSHPVADYAGRYVHAIWGPALVRQSGAGLALSIGSNPQLRGPLQHWHYDSFRAELGDGRESPGLVQFGLGTDGQMAELRIDGIEGAFVREK
jgi:CubicO group peptidase (beta-lactamase class C family)